MPRFQRFSVLPLLAILALVPYTTYAFPLPTYDLESLCYLSTDVVEVTLTRRHVAGQENRKDVFTATVIASIAGKHLSGDPIGPFDPADLDRYGPATTGQHCIMFLAPHAQSSARPAPPSAPYYKDSVEDMLLIDGHGRVRRYYQESDPPEEIKKAEGYVTFFYDGDPLHKSHFAEDDTKEQTYPTLMSEQSVIMANWAKANSLRPVFDHPPHPEDIPALQALVNEERQPNDYRQQNIISEFAQSALASLHAKAD
ncbi:MAG: hypothetical protein ACRYFS_14370 [Janthinobacterium lividum]